MTRFKLSLALGLILVTVCALPAYANNLSWIYNAIANIQSALTHNAHLYTQNDLDEISDTLLRAVRQSDLPIRWSVTELLVVLPGLGNKEARSVDERVRAALSAGVKHRLPVSGGVEEVEHDGSFFDSVDRARQKVAIAVDRGHNRVI